MRGRSALIPLGLVVLGLAAGCDTYSLTDQFEKALPAGTGPGTTDPGTTPTVEPLVLALLPNTTLTPGATLTLIPRGGTEPYRRYFVYPVAGALSYDSTLYGIIDESTEIPVYTAGTSIGELKLYVVDDAGQIAEAPVTVIPPSPGDFTVTISGPTQNTVTWTYPDLNLINGFKILRSRDGGAFTEIAAPGKNTTSYVDLTISNRAKKYTYRMQAVCGSYLSSFTLDQSD